MLSIGCCSMQIKHARLAHDSRSIVITVSSTSWELFIVWPYSLPILSADSCDTVSSITLLSMAGRDLRNPRRPGKYTSHEQARSAISIRSMRISVALDGVYLFLLQESLWGLFFALLAPPCQTSSHLQSLRYKNPCIHDHPLPPHVSCSTKLSRNPKAFHHLPLQQSPTQKC